jgi:cytochrome c-type biogenesis protein CcmE
MTRKQRRLLLIGAAALVLGIAAALVIGSLRQSIVFFFSPSELVEKQVQPGTRFRLGGLVAQGSIQRGAGDLVTFTVTDGKSTMAARYNGILPDLFREGQGVVAEGAIGPDGVFRADTVLARHDENYMPREVADALKKQGHWQEGGGAGQPAASGGKAP